MKRVLNNILGGRLLDLLILLGLNIFCHRGWFGPGVITFGDWSYYPQDFLRDSLTTPYCWTSRFFMGPQLILGGWPMQWFMGLMAHAGFDFGVGERVVYFFPFVVISVIGIYYFTFVLFKNRIACFFATIFFMFNTPTLMVAGGGLMNRMVAYALMPLVMAFYVKGLKSSSFVNFLLSGLFFSLIVIHDPQVAYLLTLPILLFFLQDLIRIIANKKPEFIRKIIRSLVYLGIVFLVPVILNFYWLYASWMAKVDYMIPGYNSTGWVKTLSYFKFSHCVAVYSPWWPPGAPGFPQQVRIIYYFVPLLVFLAVVFRRKDIYIKLLAILAVISLVLTMGANKPFGWLYLWLFKHFPGFDSFRDPGKFFLLIFLAYAPLFGAGVEVIVERIGKFNGDYRKAVKSKVVSLSVVSIILAYLFWPGMTPEIGGAFYGRKMPSEYQAIEKFIKTQQEAFRTLWRPHVGQFAFYSFKYPLFCAYKTTSATNFLFGEGLNKDAYKSKYIAKLLGLLNVKYCFIPQEEELQKVIPGKDKNFYLSDFESKNGLKKIMIENKVEAFENRYFIPLIFSTNQALLAVGSRRALLDLAALSNVDFSRLAVFFSDEPVLDNRYLSEVVNGVVFYDSAFDDLVLNSLPQKYRFDLTSYAIHFDEVAIPRKWQTLNVPPSDFYGYLYGVIPQSRGSIIYAPDKWQCDLKKPLEINIEKDDSYEIWLRVLRTPDMGKMRLTFSRDRRENEALAFNILCNSSYKDDDIAFEWKKVGVCDFKKGRYFLNIIKEEKGKALLDQLAIVPQREVELLSKSMANIIAKKDTIIIKNCYSLPLEVSVPGSGLYGIAAYARGADFFGDLDFSVNGRVIKSQPLKNQDSSLRIDFPSVALHSGNNQFSFIKRGAGSIILEKLLIYKTEKVPSSIENIFALGNTFPVEWKMINPTSYRVKTTGKGNLFLILSEPFDPRWRLNLKKPIQSTSAYGMLNSFFIKDEGLIDTTVEFVPQKYVYKGFYVSVSGLILIGIYLFFKSIRALKKSKISKKDKPL